MHEFVEKLQQPGFPYMVFDLNAFDGGTSDSVMEEISIPKYFRTDVLKRSGNCDVVHNWPTMFAAAKGTESGLHRDFGATHFWLGVVNGMKMFRIFDHAQAEGRLNLQTEDPMLSAIREKLTVHWGVIQAGDVIWVPSFWPHKVDNLLPTIAVSGNYVDETNLRAALQQFKGEGGER